MPKVLDYDKEQTTERTTVPKRIKIFRADHRKNNNAQRTVT